MILPVQGPCWARRRILRRPVVTSWAAAATPGDVEVFKDWRLTDERNPEHIKPGSFDTDRAALNTIGVITVAPWPGQAQGTASGCKSQRC